MSVVDGAVLIVLVCNVFLFFFRLSCEEVRSLVIGSLIGVAYSQPFPKFIPELSETKAKEGRQDGHNDAKFGDKIGDKEGMETRRTQ